MLKKSFDRRKITSSPRRPLVAKNKRALLEAFSFPRTIKKTYTGGLQARDMMATLRADSGSPSLPNLMGSGFGTELFTDTRFCPEWDVSCDSIEDTLFFNLPNLTTPTFGQVPNSPTQVLTDDAESKTQSYDELYSVKQEKGIQDFNITATNNIPSTSVSTNIVNQNITSPTASSITRQLQPKSDDKKRKIDLAINIEEDPEVAIYEHEHKDRRVMDNMQNTTIADSVTTTQPSLTLRFENPVKSESPSLTDASKYKETSKRSHRGAYRCGTCGHYPKKEQHDCDEELAIQRRTYRTRKSTVKKGEASSGVNKTRGPYKCGDCGYKPKSHLHDCVGHRSPNQK